MEPAIPTPTLEQLIAGGMAVNEVQVDMAIRSIDFEDRFVFFDS
jgi:hypothetical protein